MTGAPPSWPTRDLLAERAATTPERTALLEPATGDTTSVRALDRRVDRVAAALEDHCDPGERLGVLLGTGTAFVEVVHAAMRLGVPLVVLHAGQTAEELEPQVERAAVGTVVCSGATHDLARSVVDGTVVSVEDGDAAVDHLNDDETVEPATWSPTDTQLVLFTSGTTGKPKGVRLTAGNLVASAVGSAFRLGVCPGDRWFVPLPMYHMGGLAPIIRTALYGTALVVGGAFDAERTAAALAATGATGVSVVPTMLERLLDAGWTPHEELRTVLVGGAATSTGLLERAVDAGVPVAPTYGLTETASGVTIADPETARDHPGSVGAPVLGTTVTVVDPETGEPLAPGDVGEVVVDGPTVTPGYLDDERTAAAVSEHGLHTGDRGYRDEAGRVWIAGRLDDRIVTGGETVDPAEVVAALCSHPAVGDAAVLGLPDDEWGERVAALVAADGDPPPAALAEHCRERLAGYKVPRTVVLTDSLPRTASGTVDRDAVRERLRSADE